ncbi:MAG: hypothetical protein WAL16_07865 [Streptosporangiaceae bacterium]
MARTRRSPAGGTAAGTGERVITSPRHARVEGYERVPAPGPGAAGETPMFRRRSLQPSRRAVLHVQAAGDPAVPADLADWFTERAFHFYLAGLRLPGRVTLPARPGGHALGSACADLNAACARLRGDDGMGHVIVTAQRRGALAAALWSDEGARCEGALANGARGEGARGEGARGEGARGADALVLLDPELPARPALTLSIACPVLVVTTGGQPASGGRRGLLPRRPAAPAAAAQLGGHVTWLQLPDPVSPADDGRQGFFDELGRWLGAYMYGHVRDQLL